MPYVYIPEVEEPPPPLEAREATRWDHARWAYVVAAVALTATLLTASALGVVHQRHSGALSWTDPLWLTAAAIVIPLPSLALIVWGPEPWRATRWAWFWIVFGFSFDLFGGLGLLLFLLLSGPTPGVSRRPSRRVLTGGWAFLVLFVVTNVVNNAVRVIAGS